MVSSNVDATGSTIFKHINFTPVVSFTEAKAADANENDGIAINS